MDVEPATTTKPPVSRKRRHMTMELSNVEMPQYLDWDKMGIYWPQCVTLANRDAMTGNVYCQSMYKYKYNQIIQGKHIQMPVR